MRLQRKNQEPVWFARCLGKSAVLDADGNKTGEYTVSYSRPVQFMACVSPAGGSIAQEIFGITDGATRTMYVGGAEPIDKDSILWVGRSPENNAPHNYVVTRIAQSRFHTVYALKEVES